MKGRPGVLAKIVPELLESQDKEGKMWDFLLLLPGAKKQPNHLERPLPSGRRDEGLRGIPWEASQCVLSGCLAHSQHQRKYRSPAAPFSFQGRP